MNILILLFTLSLALAETRTIDMGPQDDGSKFIITVTGDFPIYTARLTAGKKHAPYAWQYINLITVDTCKVHDRFPRSIDQRGQQNDQTFFFYEMTFKCENREGSEYTDMVKARCEKPEDKNFKLICDDLLKKYGKDFITCKIGKCKDTFYWE